MMTTKICSSFSRLMKFPNHDFLASLGEGGGGGAAEIRAAHYWPGLWGCTLLPSRPMLAHCLAAPSPSPTLALARLGLGSAQQNPPQRVEPSLTTVQPPSFEEICSKPSLRKVPPALGLHGEWVQRGGPGPARGLCTHVCTHVDKWTGETLRGEQGLGARDAVCPSHLPRLPWLPGATLCPQGPGATWPPTSLLPCPVSPWNMEAASNPAALLGRPGAASPRTQPRTPLAPRASLLFLSSLLPLGPPRAQCTPAWETLSWAHRPAPWIHTPAPTPPLGT